MKLIEWLEEQIGRFTNFLSDAKEDVQKFDDHVQEEIEKYNNKQCGKAAIVGFAIGLLFSLLMHEIF
jgi:chloramphenicol O-acetyltransferase